MSCEEIDTFAIYRRERRITVQIEAPLVHGPNWRPVFESGDTVDGVARIEINGGHAVKQVKLVLVCLSQVRWLAHGKRKSLINVFTSAPESNPKESEICFERHNVLQLNLLDDDRKLTNGQYELPFCFDLPLEGLFSSLSSFHGLIKYTVEVFTIDEDRSESRGEKEIIVMAPIDEKLDMSISRASEKAFPLGPGKIGITATLDRKGYVPGECVPVKVTICNNSSVVVQARTSLHQIQIMQCNQVQQTLETCLTAEPATSEPVEPGQSGTETIPVPLASGLVLSLKSPLIVIKYYVLVTLDIPHSDDLQVKLPFVVTTRRAVENAQRVTIVRQQSRTKTRSNQPIVIELQHR